MKRSPMRLLKKIALILAILVFLSLVFLFSATLYVYSHPSRMKTFIENGIARVAGISCTIQDLSWSYHPLSLQAEGLTLKPIHKRQNFHIHIPKLRADMTLEGSFGEKTLVMNKIDVEGLSVRISQDLSLPSLPIRKSGDSLLSRMAKSAVSIVFFQDIRVEDVSLFNGEIIALLGDTRLYGNHIRAQVGEDRFLSVTLSVNAESPSKGIEINVPDLHITTDQALSLVKPEIKGRISTLKSAFKTPLGSIQRAGVQAEFLYRLKTHILALQSASLNAEGLEILYRSEKIKLPSVLRVSAKGHLNLKNKQVEFPHFSLYSEGLLKMESAFQSRKDNKTGFEISNLVGVVWPESVRSIFPNRIKDLVAPMTITGPISYKGKFTGLKEGETWDLRGGMEARFRDNPYAYEFAPRRITGVLTGTVSVQGTFPDIGLRAEMQSDQSVLWGAGIDFPPSLIQVSLSGKHPQYTINKAGLYCPSLSLPFQKREVPIKDIRLNITNGLLNTQKRSLNLPHALLDSSFLKNIQVTLKAAAKEVDFSASGSETNLIQQLSDMTIVPSGWKLIGKDAWQIHLRNRGEESWEFTLETNLQDASFQDPDGRFMGEKIEVKNSLDGEVHPGQRRVIANTALDIRAGEILLDRFYFNLNRHGLSAAGTGRYSLSDRNLELSGLRMDLTDILKMTIQGGVKPVNTGLQAHLQILIPELPVHPLFEHFLLEPFKGEQPVLKKMETDGNFSADLDLKGSGKEWNVLAKLVWHNGKLMITDPDIVLQGIQCDLPLWYRTRPAEAGKSLKGNLFIGEMRLPVLGPQSLRMQLEAYPNSLTSLYPMILEIPGGHIRMGPILMKGIFSPGRFIDTGLEINIKDTRPLLTGLLPREIGGSIEGKLETVHFKDNNLSSSGQVKAHLFGGEILLSDIAASGLFTPAPAVRLSAQWDDLNLAEITADTEFGKIEGILRGGMKDFELAYGQPQRFELWTETVKKEGVPQRISVKAVENISRIGGGQSPFVGMAGILTSFFKEFPYRKMGIRASLENDVFRIHGTIKEGDKEYVIKRDGFSGVDVVNQNPDNRIRFKDMIKRIKRVTSSKGGPVIK